ncbi:MAG: DUF1858 domain-containing protein [Deltaproteobacteria bacterium]|nr:DUF1858 domain-containing protein [Deltaproteobacteria bacterium]
MTSNIPCLPSVVVVVAPEQRQEPTLVIDWDTMNLDSKMTVSELITAHPSVMGVFMKHRLLCIGCPAETFHTLEDVASINGIALGDLMKDLRRVADARVKS